MKNKKPNSFYDDVRAANIGLVIIIILFVLAVRFL